MQLGEHDPVRNSAAGQVVPIRHRHGCAAELLGGIADPDYMVRPPFFIEWNKNKVDHMQNLDSFF
ncbi:hypothetical protein, partial [Nocardia sp. NPDC004604]|uniref:hypothetical protein n=1 Tax=Nocardia sp. NPDC004604 TaxID=3157013 RepID=UPI0033B824BE